MKAILQRVGSAAVSVDGKETGSCGTGLFILLGVEDGDGENDALFLAEKISKLRIFEDENGKMNLSVKDIQGEMLIVSQFTLCADIKKGTRPSFDNAMKPDEANDLYEYFLSKVKETGIPVKTGVFGAHMEINLLNDGPVTFTIQPPVM